MRSSAPYLLIILLIVVNAPRALGQRDFANTIYVGDSLPAPVQESVKDMANWLQKSTGKQFAIKPADSYTGQGIQVLWEKESELPASIRNQLQRDGQSFFLYVSKNANARIIGTGKNSFTNGIYTFLQELGFRWYMPGDAWTIVPSEFPSGPEIKKVYTPDFQGRVNAGSGGLNVVAGTDPKNTFKADYRLWNERNRYNSDYTAKGHAGQLFYSDNKKTLDANPSWFCNGAVNRHGRIDIANPSVVKVFTDWALRQVKPIDSFSTIGIDPADGAGGPDDCLPVGMQGIKTWSDKYFWLANQVAKKLDQKDTKTKVTLYAYSRHADPPAFPLEKKVYPILVPYAFQRNMGALDFIKLWSKKLEGRPMGMYDYWNITQWSVGIPQFNIYTIPEKLRLWKQHNVSLIALETSNGKGATGHVLWLGSQMMWNTKISFDSLYNDFLSTCFGPAATDMKRMYDRWSTNYQEEMEVDLSLHDLATASAKTRDRAIQTRLNELKAYVHYLKLYYDYQAAPESAAAFEGLVKYVHSIHYLRMVHSSALLERYIKPPAGYKKQTGLKLAPQVSPLSASDIEAQFQKDITENDVYYTNSGFVFDITKARVLINEPIAKPQKITGRNNYKFFLAKPGVFKLKAGSTVPTRLTITDAELKTSFEKIIPASQDGFSEIKVQLPAGIYNLSFGDNTRRSRLELPMDMVFMSSGVCLYDNAGYPALYVYIPDDVDAVIYEDKLGPGVNKKGFWLNPAGERVDPVKLKNKVYKIDVPKQYRGSVWTLIMGHRQFKLLNIPNSLSLRKFKYAGN